MPDIRLDLFDAKTFERGRSRVVVMLWMIARWIFLDTAAPWPYRIKCFILRAFGAKVGRGVVLRTRVYVHYPWRLEIADHCWVGDGCQFMNFEWIRLDPHVALAHEVYIAAGSHDIRSATMAAQNAPVHIHSGCWLASRSFIGPGVTIGANSVVGAAAVVMRDVEPGVVVIGNPARVVRQREIDRP